MPKNRKIWVGIIVVIIVALVGWRNYGGKNQGGTIKIGVITDLSGPAAYWGESTRAGAELAAQELKQQGYDVRLVLEDYRLDAAKAASAAQKLVNVDGVDGIYAEFNPAAVSVGSYLKDKKLLFVYDAAVVSPLANSPYAYKTYLDYQTGCRDVAKKFKEGGMQKIGILKVNLEFGDLCLNGVRAIYGSKAFSEGYNLGDVDFRTQLLKLKSNGVGAVVNVGFEGDTANTLKDIRDFKYTLLYGTVDDTITDAVKNQYASQLKGAWSFGFRNVEPAFSEKLKTVVSGSKLATEYGAALAYTHLRQMAVALSACGKDYSCVTNKMDDAPADTTIGFDKFESHVATLNTQLREY